MEELRIKTSTAENVTRAKFGIDNANVSHFVPDASNLDQMIDDSERAKWNQMIDEQNEKFKTHEGAVEEAVNNLAHSINNCQIKPLGNYVIVKPFKENPFQKVKVSESGIIYDLGGYQPEYKNSDTGDLEEAEQMIITGVVIETGPDCKYLKVGDTIMWDKPTALPIPFFSFGFYRVNENLALCVINDDLDKRF